MKLFTDKHILLGVTGSIAAYKAAELASKLTQAGAQVDGILTPAAEKFITPLTFQSVTGRKVFIDADLWGGQAHVLHVGLGQSADLLVIAPCTANTLAKLAHGIADNLLTITALAARCPMLVAPAMDVGIYTHPATQEAIRILTERGVTFAGPGEGRMASGLVGKGRFLEPAELLGHIRFLLGRHGRLAGRKIVITAGGTQEPLDPVRVLTNKSSGKQGYALAQAGLDAGGTVILISAPTALPPPVGARLISVTTAGEMLEAVLAESAGADALVMAAAVADFRPKQVAENKLKKRDGIPQVTLEATPDILVAVAGLGSRRPRVVIGFAAESRDLLKNAEAKLKSKNLDMIVANDISAPDSGFGVDTNRVTLLFSDANQQPLSLMSKDEVAETIIAHLAMLLEIKMTKVLVISDVHANIIALEAVLADAGKVDEVWCLGDIAGYGPDPNECIERIQALPELTCMMGNHDYAAIGDMALEVFNSDAKKALLWQREMLTDANKEFLRTLLQKPKMCGSVTLVHGSPRDPIWEYIMNTLVARINMDFYETLWCLVGHSHFQAVFQYHSETDEMSIQVPRPSEGYELRERAILNPGSVGQPRDRDPRAAYAIFKPKDKIWEPHRVEYDIKTVQKRILDAGLPPRHAERLAGGW